jgi:NTP pyrophosphatase (non-canonical NTP hydrolase)
MDAIGLNFSTQYGNYILDADMAEWMIKNASISMFNSSRSYVYNKALSEYVKARELVTSPDVTNIEVNSPIEIKRSINEQLEEAFSRFYNAMEQAKANEKPVKQDDNVYSLIRNWAAERGIYKSGDSKTQYVKLMEEAGELAQAILKQDKDAIRDAIGDMIVVLTNLAHLEHMLVEDCITSAYDEIKNRKGAMYNGTFVKEGKVSYITNDCSTINTTNTHPFPFITKNTL